MPLGLQSVNVPTPKLPAPCKMLAVIPTVSVSKGGVPFGPRPSQIELSECLPLAKIVEIDREAERPFMRG